MKMSLKTNYPKSIWMKKKKLQYTPLSLEKNM